MRRSGAQVLRATRSWKILKRDGESTGFSRPERTKNLNQAITDVAKRWKGEGTLAFRGSKGSREGAGEGGVGA